MLWWVAPTRRTCVTGAGSPGWRWGWCAAAQRFAVWTSGGGLETRQFTLFVVLAVVCLSLYRHRFRGLLAASLSLAAAAYTRPEGPLIAAGCFGWFVVQRVVETGRLWPDRRLIRELVWLVGPFFVLVAAHFLFRYAYYGEWLPNTYYAKHVRPWYEAGFRYLLAAALETGLYLLLPLTLVALRGALAVLPGHGLRPAAGVHRPAYGLPSCVIGGDHFAYRPLDFYWAAAGRAGECRDCVSGRPAARLAAPTGPRPARRAGRARWPCSCPVLFYTTFVQNTALVYREAEINHPLLDFAVGLSALVAPGVQPLFAITDDPDPEPGAAVHTIESFDPSRLR